MLKKLTLESLNLIHFIKNFTKLVLSLMLIVFLFYKKYVIANKILKTFKLGYLLDLDF